MLTNGFSGLLMPILITFVILLSFHGETVLSIRESRSAASQREDLFSSTSKLEDLVENEEQIIDVLDTFADYTMEKANLIKA